MTDTWTWATVTQASPLRIKVDGDTSELDATTDNLVGSLAVDDRVRVHLHSDGIIVTGIQGGVVGTTEATAATANTLALRDANARIKAADGVAADDVATVGQLIPIGGGITWWGPSDPASPGGGIEYAIPDGRTLSRTTYAVLFALWGTTFGTGNGTSTFNMPNAKGRVQVGRDSGDWEFNSMGETRGAKTHTHPLSGNGSALLYPSSDGIVLRRVQAGGDWDGDFHIAGTRSPGTYARSGGVELGGSTDSDSSIQPSIVANTAIRIK